MISTSSITPPGLPLRAVPVVYFFTSENHRSYAGNLTQAAATSLAVKTLDPQVSPSFFKSRRPIVIPMARIDSLN
jgi:hypothetical protein